MPFQSKARVEKVVKVPVGEQTSRLGEKECGNIWLRSLSRLHHRILSTSCISATSQTFCFLLQFNPAESAPLSMYVCNCTCMHFTTVATDLKTELIKLCCHKCLR